MGWFIIFTAIVGVTFKEVLEDFVQIIIVTIL